MLHQSGFSIRRRHLPGCLLVAVLLVAGGTTYGQNPNATVSGTVTDPTGAVIPGATVIMTNTGTGLPSKAITNNSGQYRIGDLIPGLYQANVTMQGFKTLVKDNIELHVEDQVALNFPLELGAAGETVTVEGGQPLIDTQSTSLGSVIEGRETQDTPLNGRNPMNLIALVPGVVPQGVTGGSPSSNQAPGSANPAGFGNYQIGGGLAGWNAMFVDGASVNATGQNWSAMVPTQDSISEFRVDTNAVTPQFGRFAGGVVSFSTKSGSNSFHGTAYDYLRNTDFDANSFLNNLQGQPRNVLEQNQFGADLGGPIVKDKTFFFFSWEDTHLDTSSAFANYVPTPAEMSGDFRLSPVTLATGVTIDPKTGKPASCNGVANVVCASELDPTAAAMYAHNYFAQANPALVAQMVNSPTPANNPSNPIDVRGVTKQTNNAIQYVTRVDHQLGDKQRLFARYTYWSIAIPPEGGEVPAPVFRGIQENLTTNQAVLGDTLVLSPTLTADIRLTFTRFLLTSITAGTGNQDLSVLGPAWATIGAEVPFKALPVFLPGGQWLNQPFTLDIQQPVYQNIYGLSGSLNKVSGNHTVTFGAESRRYEYYGGTSISPSGNFVFFGQNAIANFAEGVVTPIPGLSQIQPISSPSAYNYYLGLYVNDVWRLSSKLTLNLGVRWEVPGSWEVKGDKDSVLLPNLANPLGSIVNPDTGATQTLMGQLAAVNSPAYPNRAQTQEHWRLFEPRAGANYALTPNTVFRVGFGISSPCIDCGSSSALPSTSPLNSATTLSTTSLSNPFPNGVLLPLGHNVNIMEPYNVFPRTLEGTVVTGQDPNQAYPYVMQWNANVERALGSTASISLSYSGSRGVHIGTQDINLDQLPDQYDALGGRLLTQVNNPLYGLVSPASGVGGPTAMYGQFLLPYPEFTQFVSAGQYKADSIYHSMIVHFRKRLSHGSIIDASYTWAHFIDSEDSQNGFLEPGQPQTGVPGQDYTNIRGDRADSAADVRHRFVFNYVLDLPFGRGQRFLSQAGGLTNRIVSGWTFSGITTLQSGIPMFFTLSGGNALSTYFGAGTIRPNVVAGCDKFVSGSYQDHINSSTPVFNTGCFTSPGQFSFGTESRTDSALRQPGILNFDMDLGKAAPITERVSLRFDAQFFNVFNRTQFAGPSTALGTGNFGLVTGAANNQPRIGQLSLRLNF